MPQKGYVTEYIAPSALDQQLHDLAVLGLREQMELIGSSTYIKIEFHPRAPGYTSVYCLNPFKQIGYTVNEVFYINSPGV